MAARKGKAGRRIKDWQRRLRQTDAESFDANEGETLQPQRVKLPPWRVQEQTGQVQDPDGPQAEGMVVGLFPGGACVRIADEDVPCQIAGTFRPPPGVSALAVGDIVTVAMALQEHVSLSRQRDKDRADGAIISRRPRKTALSRPEPTSGKRRGGYNEEPFEKVVAANMEILLIVASVAQPAFRPSLIDRFCIVAERGEMAPVIVVNKIDLGEPDETLTAELAGGEIPLLRSSAATGEGLDELRAFLTGRSAVLAGASGVGKSTLINALVPEANLPTRQIRMKDQRGRHTTAATTVHKLSGGGLLVDTPGVRELGLEMQASELAWYFPELAELAGQCRFNDCSHTHEPDCAVRQAAEAGGISPRRFRSYLRILESL